MKKSKLWFLIFIILVIWIYWYIQFWENWEFKVEKITVISDIDNDWINDIDDILQWARSEIKNKTIYKSAYYVWGYPPSYEGVCTDVIRRALKNAWIDLKILIDTDIKNNVSAYGRVEWNPDPNIDFRRVPNLNTFLIRNTISLTIKIEPWNKANLKEWQAWDIVIFDYPKSHTAIISDKRDKDWVPYIIHNSAPVPKENNMLIYWDTNLSKIIWHYRWKY